MLGVVQCANWRSQHKVPIALTPLIIRWGAETGNDVLRQRAHCTKCGHTGVVLQCPSWVGLELGFQPFPVDRLAIERLQ
jgi:hypothetical protein